MFGPKLPYDKYLIDLSLSDDVLLSSNSIFAIGKSKYLFFLFLV